MAEYRRFIEKTLDEAKKKMVQEMGINAYIIKINKVVKRSMLGLKKEEWVELQAGKLDRDTVVYENKEDLQDKEKLNPIKTYNAVSNHKVNSKVKKENNFKEKEDKIKKLQQVIKNKNKNFLKDFGIPADKNRHLVEKELEMRVESLQRESQKSIKLEKNTHKEKLKNFLIEKEFSLDFIEYLTDYYQSNFNRKEETLLELADYIASRFRYSSKPKVYASGANIIMLVGSTGVGKTTTLAKLAAELSLNQSKQTALCTFDIKRIMATVQLEKYAEMMGIDFKVIVDKASLKKMIGEFIHHSYILLDTSGITEKDTVYFNEIKEFIEYITLPKEINICLNASSRYTEILRVMEQFKKTSYDRVIITKKDESSTLGPVLSAIYKNNTSISFITHGQDVPSDIKVASHKEIKKILMEEWKL